MVEDILERVELLAKSGTFNRKSKFLRAVVNPNVKMAPNFASQIGFFLLEFEKENEVIRLPIVTKIQPKGDFERMIQNSDNQFFSEVTMYTEILPQIGADKLDCFPKFLHGEASLGKHPERDIVIMEDLQMQGYTTADELFLAPEAIRTILKKLGEFHGLTYRAKISNQDILSVGKSLPHKVYPKQFDLMNLPCIERGFKAIQSTIQSPVLDGALEKIRRSGPTALWTEMRLPKEPFATIIHGDFNKNNLMFKFSENGEVEHVKFLDFQTSIYSDPTVDIAFLLYMNTSQDTRNAHWDAFLKVYWEGVTSICPSPGFTFEEFLENFGVRALFGYLPCSFFLPSMLETKKVSLGEFATWDLETQIKRMVGNGGQKGTDAVFDIVKDLLDRGYLEQYLKKF